MGTITASLERSLRNCTLNHENGAEAEEEKEDGYNIKVPDGAVFNTGFEELNSHVSLPYYWEQQGLDVKTAEFYYKKRRDGAEPTEDPMTEAAAENGRDLSSSEEDDGDIWYDSEDYLSYSSELSPSRDYNDNNNDQPRGVLEKENDNVLVVAGCRSCYMYFMVPKKVEDCPKCNGHLLRFDRSPSSSPSST
ncbi:Detected protein of unknown function [Hibiscus syriacus]|uniref:Uncharacterized protein n=1 Tax=Hibiscus syriacus TaxID=106335 RepID=A0A6A2X3M5_HIBSY|nr:uncharacterized protein LOC120176059 [Hibiscus syriacus]KAE8669613.1 Detected protein of unknown function [Hibiscus syriacus]